MKKYILPVLTFVIVSFQSLAQNLNPTVEITNTYKATLMDIDKPKIDMAVPDSVLKFDLDFKYSIFDRPYKGAYLFSPYIMDMKPNPDAYRAKNLYIRAGAGYPFKPDLDFVFSPRFKSRFKMNIYGFHKSYIGNFTNISVAHEKSAGGPIALVSKNMKFFGPFEYGSAIHKGYDIFTRAGANGGYDWEKAGFTFDMGYYGIHTKDTLAGTALNMFVGKIGLYSKNNGENYFYYDARAGIRRGADYLDISGLGGQKLMINEFELEGTFGPVIGGSNKILVDAHILGVIYGSLINSHSGILAVTPHYVYEKDRWRMSLGVKFSTRQRSDAVFEGFSLNENPSQIFYPDVRIGYEVIRNHLNFFLKATGGNNMNSYISQKSDNHFFNPYFGRRVSRLSDNTVERLNASLGVEGNISENFKYNASAGVAIYNKGRLDAMYYKKLDSGIPIGNLAGVAFSDFNMVYASLNAVWDRDPVMIDGSFMFRSTDIYSNKVLGFEPARFSGNIRARYNWNNRVFVGVCTGFATERRGFAAPASGLAGNMVEVSIPEFYDLGITAEYKLSKKFSVWVTGGNLLNATIQRSPLYVDSGISLTAGICLNL